MNPTYLVTAVPKLGFGTAGLFEDTKSAVSVALSSGYRYIFVDIEYVFRFAMVRDNII